MYQLKKKLLATACVVGMIGLGYVSPARAFESKILTNSPVVETEIKELNYPGYNLVTICKTLKNGVKITETDYGQDGKIDERTLEQNFSDGRRIVEIDRGADGNIDHRITFDTDGSILHEKQLPDGSIRKELSNSYS